MKEWSIFYISDSTAITAKGLGKSLLSLFNDISLREHLRPFVNTREKVLELIDEIKQAKRIEERPPIVFASMMDEELMTLLSAHTEIVIDIFQPFIAKLEALIDAKSSKQVGQAHKVINDLQYQKRLSAIDFSLATDDGLHTEDYNKADLILLGLSRSGKTPTALYLALQFGLKVANYPFTAEDLPIFKLKPEHLANRSKLFGLVISPERLGSIRQERRPGSIYADSMQIKQEISALNHLFLTENIAHIDTTNRSVEEIASSIVASYHDEF